MKPFDFLVPKNEEELKSYLKQESCRILAGGTDVLPRLQRNTIEEDVIVDISGLKSLNSIREEGDYIAIGATTTFDEILRRPVDDHGWLLLQKAASTIGCTQTRNRATLGGNIANASPAADSIPALLILDGEVILASEKGQKNIPLTDFFLGPGKTNLKHTEYIHSIRFRRLAPDAGVSYQKLGRRNGMAISVVSVATTLSMKQGVIQRAGIAFGAMAPTPLRMDVCEKMLIGKSPSEALFKEVCEQASATLHPITDLRGTDKYRNHAAKVLLFRALYESWDTARGNSSPMVTEGRGKE